MNYISEPLTQPIRRGTMPLGIRERVRNPDGSVSTVKTMSIGTDEGEVLIPTVFNGRVNTPEASIARWRKTGQDFGAFSSPEDATAFALMLHRLHEKELGQ